jgi:hypothetical protein
MAMADNPVYLVSVLIEELKIELMQGRLNSIREELDIARALGGERARKEQIQLLSDYIDAEDERLLAIWLGLRFHHRMRRPIRHSIR